MIKKMDNKNTMDRYSLGCDGSFTIKDYNYASAFSNFLPGIAGLWGVPMWVFYVNRGQGVISFGIKDKNHSVTEFLPANKAYWLASSVGFRTFLKTGGAGFFYEPFSINHESVHRQSMIVRSQSLEITENNAALGLEFSVRYYTLPNSAVSGLVRVLSIKNISGREVDLEILDGLPRIIPFGSGDFFLKNMSQTLEAWMRSYVEDNLAIFRLIVDPADVSETKYVQGANFNYSFYQNNGAKISPYIIVDPQVIFGYDTSYLLPIRFVNGEFKTPVEQITCGKTPCAFSYFNWKLRPNEEKSFYSVFGASFKLELIKKCVSLFNFNFMKEKEEENKRIIEDIKDNAFCVSGIKEFDQYVKSTYLDNVLRGGYPYKFDGKDIYYVFSRKHGDLERDYNRFELLPSYFSEGEANYRDINQNRRMDLFFNPFIGRKNIVYFASLLRIDGYNPMVVKGEKLKFDKKTAKAVLDKFDIKDPRLVSLMQGGFYLGEFFKFIEEENIAVKNREALAQELVVKAIRQPHAHFGEGFWIDHWFYNLDLIENYLYIYPDKVKELFLTKDTVCWDDEHRVKERNRRYTLKNKKVFQYNSIEAVEDKKKIINQRPDPKNFLRTKKGQLYKSTLFEKLIVLVLNKLATLDPDGIGIEMEAGKPGWCDSLNGLPALLGSSICETFELKKTCMILLDALKYLKKNGISQIALTSEVLLFLSRLDKTLADYFRSISKKRDYLWWDKANAIKENFRNKTFYSIEGIEKKIKTEKIKKFLDKTIEKLNPGIEKAKDKENNVYYTYFTYDVKKYRVKKTGVLPLVFKRKPIPLFLEGPMHALKVEADKKQYSSLKNTELFDKILKMYRLNTSLENQPLEIGRSRVFVPGWLENESVWLHMEYKYLLQVLKNGFYKEFFEDFRNCGVCFFEPKKYGRNILENASFIVSSAYPDKNLWGRGFVARLSGATAEFLNIWVLLVLGHQPFVQDKNNNLCFKFSPILKGEMFTEKEETINFKGEEVVISKNSFAFKLFSSILIVYHNSKRKDTFDNNCRISQIIVESEGKKHKVNSNMIETPLSIALRDVKADRIDVYFE